MENFKIYTIFHHKTNSEENIWKIERHSLNCFPPQQKKKTETPNPPHFDSLFYGE